MKGRLDLVEEQEVEMDELIINDYEQLAKRLQAGSLSKAGQGLMPPPKDPMPETQRTMQTRAATDPMGNTQTRGISPADRKERFRRERELADKQEMLDEEEKKATLMKNIQRQEEILNMSKRSKSRGTSIGKDEEGYGTSWAKLKNVNPANTSKSPVRRPMTANVNRPNTSKERRQAMRAEVDAIQEAESAEQVNRVNRWNNLVNKPKTSVASPPKAGGIEDDEEEGDEEYY